MLRFIFVSFLLITNAYSSEIILSAFERSGYVHPDDSYEKDCTIHVTGLVTVEITRGGRRQQTTAIYARKTIEKLMSLIEKASTNTLTQGAAMCDGGDRRITGYMESMEVTLEDRQDCNSTVIRDGDAAEQARELASELCGFY